MKVKIYQFESQVPSTGNRLPSTCSSRSSDKRDHCLW